MPCSAREKLTIVSCYSRSTEKREASRISTVVAPRAFEEILDDNSIEGIINTTPNSMHRTTTIAAAKAGKHTFLDKPIANTIDDARALTKACRYAWCSRSATSAGAKATSAGSRRTSPVWQTGERGGEHQPRPAGKIDLSSWRYTAEGMPGGVMLQIGIHYTDVLEYLMGPIRAVSGRSVRLVLPAVPMRDFVLEHENGAPSTLNASYASASEYYLMNIYGKEATAFYDLHGGLRWPARLEQGRGHRPQERSDRGGARGVARAARGDGEPGDGRRERHRIARRAARRHQVGVAPRKLAEGGAGRKESR